MTFTATQRWRRQAKRGWPVRKDSPKGFRLLEGFSEARRAKKPRPMRGPGLKSRPAAREATACVTWGKTMPPVCRTKRGEEP